MQVKNFLNSTEAKLHHLVALMQNYAKDYLSSEFDISFNQFRVLMILTEKDNINQKYLSKCMDVTEAAISKILFELENKKYIKAEINPQNRRQRKLSLTRKGLDLIKKTAGYLSTSTNSLFSEVTKEERKIFDNVLDKLLKSFTL